MKRLLFCLLSVLVLSMFAEQSLVAQTKAKTMTATGTVKSVSGDSLVIAAGGGKDMTFTLDGATKVIGKGLSTKKMEKGKKLTAAEAMSAGDQVSITYSAMNGAMHAAEVKVLNKK